MSETLKHKVVNENSISYFEEEDILSREYYFTSPAMLSQNDIIKLVCKATLKTGEIYTSFISIPFLTLRNLIYYHDVMREDLK